MADEQSSLPVVTDFIRLDEGIAFQIRDLKTDPDGAVHLAFSYKELVSLDVEKFKELFLFRLDRCKKILAEGNKKHAEAP